VLLAAIAVSGPGRRFYALAWPSGHDVIVLGSITLVSIVVFESVLAVLRKFGVRLLEPETGRALQ